MEPVASIEYVAGPPAPGRLVLVERFCNTVDPEHGREVLHDAAALKRVLCELDLIDPSVAVTRGDLAAALDLRERIRALARANNGVPTGVTIEAELSARIDDEHATLGPRRRDVDGALSDLVGIVYTSIADGTWPRLKACRAELCGWLFYDRSRNRSAVWCSMAVCGNRTKTRAYRARRP